MRANRRRGLTIIELLVATAVTLVMVLAVSEAFVVVSSTVSTNRAALEMSGQLRGVSRRLQLDLDDATAPVEPWLGSGAGLGYFEYIEGPGNDFDSNPIPDGIPIVELGMLVYEDYNNRTVTARGIDAKQPGGDSTIGDRDDVLMYTIRTSGEPFVGQVMGELGVPDNFGRRPLVYDPTNPTFTTIESDTAEVVWFVFGGTLYRRVLLVRPDIFIPPNSGLQDRSGDMPDVFFFSGNDLSVRLEPFGSPLRFIRVTNSLSTLTLRQNRFAHQRTDPTNLMTDFPYPVLPALLTPKRNVFQRGNDGGWGQQGTNDVGTDGQPITPATVDDVAEAGAFGSDDVLIRYAIGEDVVLRNVLAFDVRVWDPTVQVREYIAAGDVLLPGSPGFYSPNDPTLTQRVGYGGFVDLGYRFPPDPAHVGSTPANSSNELFMQASATAPVFWRDGNGLIQGTFIGLPAARSQLGFPTFDTWPLDYERDGLDQDGDGLTDEGANGQDDNPAAQNGVDDLSERETAPPYNAPMSGLRIKLRLLDPDSRQVRQVTVSSDFTEQ